MAITPLKFELPLSMCPRIIHAHAAAPHGGREGIVERYRLEKVYYRVERLWCLNLFLGDGELKVDKEVIPIHTGYAGITRPGVDLEYRYTGPATLSWVHFVPDAAAESVPIAAMHDLGERFEEFRADVRTVASSFMIRPQRCEALLWALLWRIADASVGASDPRHMHPAVESTVGAINQQLRHPLSVAKLADDVGISQNHLNRLFHATFGTTVADYLRMRRVKRAEHLLTHSNIPIKAIAAEAGFADVQTFSHVMKRILGKSPRQIRLDSHDSTHEPPSE